MEEQPDLSIIRNDYHIDQDISYLLNAKRDEKRGYGPLAQVPPLGGRSVANLSDLISPPTQTREVVKKIAYLITSTKEKRKKKKRKERHRKSKNKYTRRRRRRKNILSHGQLFRWKFHPHMGLRSEMGNSNEKGRVKK